LRIFEWNALTFLKDEPFDLISLKTLGNRVYALSEEKGIVSFSLSIKLSKILDV